MYSISHYVKGGRVLDKLEPTKQNEQKQGTSLGQLIIAMLSFILIFPLVIIGGIYFFEDPSNLPRIARVFVVMLIAGGAYGGHFIGGKLFPAAKYGKVNVSRIVWSVLGLFVFALACFVCYYNMFIRK